MKWFVLVGVGWGALSACSPRQAQLESKTGAARAVSTEEGASFGSAGAGSAREAKREAPRYDAPPTSHREALERQLEGTWEKKKDKDRLAWFPHVDAPHWKRVRFRGLEHFTGFQYGEDKHLVTGAFVVKTRPGEAVSSQLCMERFEEVALRKFQKHQGKQGQVVETRQTWRRKPLLVHQTDGRLTVFFSRYEFSAAWAAYPAYEDGCLVYAVVSFWNGEEELARTVRDRWVEEGFSRFKPLTREVPERREP